MRKEADYYAIVQVDPGADREVIDAAYRRLAAKYHPDVDRSPGATERMKLLNAAYEVLSHPEKRKAYDRRRGNPDSEGLKSGVQEAVKRQLTQWITTAALTILMLALAGGASRFGARMLFPVVLLVLLGLLLMTRRKG